MRGKQEEISVNESASNVDHQTIQSNPHENRNVDHQTIQSNPHENRNVDQPQRVVQSNPYESTNVSQPRQVIQSNPNESTNVSQPRQVIQSNPYENKNVNQSQQVIGERASEEPPPAYITSVQPPSNPQLKVENVVQNSSLNNQRAQATPIINNTQLGRHPIDVICPNCGATVHTRAETSSTIITVVIAVLLFLFCFCLAIIPFCMSSCKRTIHYCPNCNRILGTVHEFE